MTIKLSIELPDDSIDSIDADGEAFVRELRIAAAVKWYEQGRVSQGKAAALAGLSRSDFLGALSKYKVSPFQITPEELE